MPSAVPVTVVRCAVPSPLRRLLDYRLPDGCAPTTPGQRVLVPLAKRRVVAVIIDIGQHSELPLEQLRTVSEVLDEAPLIDANHLRLMRWLADYYVHPPGEVIPLAFAPRERRGEPPAPTGIQGLRLTLRGQGLPAGALRRAKRQATLLAMLQDGPQTITDLTNNGISRAIMRELISKALAEYCQLAPDRNWSSRPALKANHAQRMAIDSIAAERGNFSCHLLQGVTGSGKTEVYLQAIAQTLSHGDQALVLLPEIALSPQMLERFRARFRAPVVELHSGLSDAVRDKNWAAARSGEAAVIIGTRSAVFVPLARPGLIVVDEEHEATFTQQDGLRYSARDVAVKRAQLCACPVVLGSATPSLETFDNARRGRFQHSQLRAPAIAAAAPEKSLIDVRGLALEAGLSAPLLTAVSDTLDRNEHALLFLNRRGFAPTFTCEDCGWVAACDHCDARMTLHRHPVRLLCHHCGHRAALPPRCPTCKSTRLTTLGLGTEQTETAIRAHYANYPIHRVDSDTIRTRNDMVELREALGNDEPVVLIGTQMLAKGHDFPRVTLVGVIDADALLFSTDYRGEERLLQLLTQVAGRAGRGSLPGRVLIQTRHPDHELMQGLLTQDYTTQAQGLLAARYARGLPPAGALALFRTDSRSTEQGQAFLQQLMTAFQPADLLDCRLVGPLAAPLARRAGLCRTQVIVTGPNRRAVGQVARKLVAHAETMKTPSGMRWFVDIDPIDGI